MRQPLTERQESFVSLAAGLADTFARRASTFDRENRFPVENYDDLRSSGYLRLTVPEELGGLGANLYDLVLAQERLAAGCASTALAVNMHVSPIGQWGSFWRETGDTRLEALLRRVAKGEIIWAALTSEPGMPNHMSDALTTAEIVDEGFHVRGRKIFCTNSHVATHFTFTARYEDPDTGPRLGIFWGEKDAGGFEFVPTWDTLGMRGTQSDDLLIDAVVPREALVHSLPLGHLDGRVVKQVFAWAMPTFGAVYLGIGAGILEEAKRIAVERGRDTDPLVGASLAQMEILLETGRAVLYRHCEEVMSGRLFKLSPQEALTRSVMSKVVPTNNAVQIGQQAVDVVGGAAFTRKLPLERMWRDLQGGPIMPYSNHHAIALVAATSLGVEIAPEIPFAESGHTSRPHAPVSREAVRG